MARKKSTPTFEERSAAAAAKAGAALSIFVQAADDLQEAAVEQAALHADIERKILALYAEIGHLDVQSKGASEETERLLAQAQSIRALAGIN